MDWAYVGGGFAGGIHSTIEPAIYGLPIVGGPRGREKFDEIGILERQGQMRVLPPPGESRSAMRDWMVGHGDFQGLSAERVRWIEANRGHREASARTWKALLETLSGRTRGLHRNSNA
jgi:3-deoxy-D-manno-octulosonic-acid transferase